MHCFESQSYVHDMITPLNQADFLRNYKLFSADILNIYDGQELAAQLTGTPWRIPTATLCQFIAVRPIDFKRYERTGLFPKNLNCRMAALLAFLNLCADVVSDEIAIVGMNFRGGVLNHPLIPAHDLLPADLYVTGHADLLYGLVSGHLKAEQVADEFQARLGGTVFDRAAVQRITADAVGSRPQIRVIDGGRQ